MKAKVRGGTTPSLRLIFDGQSHNLVPTLGGILGQPYPWHLTRSRGVPWGVVAISGASWTTLLTTIASRLYPCLNRADSTVLLMSGGTSDINAADTGAQAYADHVTYADLARANGADLIIACTLLGSTSFDTGENTQRQSLNSLLLADADEAFDGVADVDAAFVATYGASYWTDENVFFDGTHMFGDSPRVYAETVAPILDGVLP